jgi:hypothetical protein
MPKQMLLTSVSICLLIVGCDRYRAGETKDRPQNASSEAQPQTNCVEGQFPGRIQLLPGYKMQTCGGMEYLYGKIWKQEGASIEFSEHWIDYSESPEMWRQDQMVDGEHMLCSFRKDQTMEIRFRGTQFDATVRNQQELAEMFLTVASYVPPAPASLPATAKTPK